MDLEQVVVGRADPGPGGDDRRRPAVARRAAVEQPQRIGHHPGVTATRAKIVGSQPVSCMRRRATMANTAAGWINPVAASRRTACSPPPSQAAMPAPKALRSILPTPMAMAIGVRPSATARQACRKAEAPLAEALSMLTISAPLRPSSSTTRFPGMMPTLAAPQ
ncbi:MAG: hypothetical protein LC792_06070 [Actinobacteria bacterium]|nr:hypothetical protein [Actinomycetota bacterium]